MRISSFKIPEQTTNDGIALGNRFNGWIDNLNKVVVLTGANGCGKSRFLKVFQNTFEEYKNNINYNEICFKTFKWDSSEKKEYEAPLTKEEIQKMHLINYSHFDARLQGTKNFSPYVIHQARQKLKQCNYEETALNSLLFLKDLVEGYSDESNETNDYRGLIIFIEEAKEFELEFSWDPTTKRLKLFDQDLDDARLSPGQLYALRIAVACQAHEVHENSIFLLDEPETHLHPSLLIKIINKLLSHFKDAQFFISTHSLPLISYLAVTVKDTSVFYIERGTVIDRLRSDSQPILNSLIGTEDQQFAIKQLFASPDNVACNKFCMECFLDPTTVSGGTHGDPSATMAEKEIPLSDANAPFVIVDYGAGEGRLLECILEDGFTLGYVYNAYNVEPPAATVCQRLIKSANISGNSFSDKKQLEKLNGTVDRVFMVNVLHEIDPKLWKNEFDTISNLLKKDGKLIIIEREILTIGEAPFKDGYLMLTGNGNKSPAAEALFGENNVSVKRHSKKPYIVAYTVEQAGVKRATNACMKDVLSALHRDAKEQLKSLKRQKPSLSEHIDRYKHGISLAFWLNQMSCTLMYIDELS